MAWFELGMQALWQRLGKRAQRIARVRFARAEGWKLRVDRRRTRPAVGDVQMADRRRVAR